MGTNKRYPHLPAQRGRRESCASAQARPLRTLDSLQLRLHARPLTIVPEQMTIWGHAWLQFGDTNVRCVVQVKRWTADAVGVQVTIDGDKLRCWVWQEHVSESLTDRRLVAPL
uniref:hypothetical protein n=1 Tax=Helicobacter pylori TaxID=210 RepID=UPI0037C12C2B